MLLEYCKFWRKQLQKDCIVVWMIYWKERGFIIRKLGENKGLGKR